VNDGAPGFSETVNAFTSVFSATWDSPGTHTVTLEAENIGGSAVALHPIDIGSAGEPGEKEIGPDGDVFLAGSGVSINFPAGAFELTTTVQYDPDTEATPPDNAVKSFTLSATDSTGVVTGTQQPFDMAFTFTVAELEGADINTLELQCWNGSAWETLPDVLTVINSSRVSAQLDSFGQCVLAPGEAVTGDNQVFLPLIVR
jgi:hypothetical protein